MARHLLARFRLADICFPFSPNAKHGPRLLLFLVYRCQLVHFLSFSLSSFSPFVFFKKMQMGIFSQRGRLHNSTTLNVPNNKLETQRRLLSLKNFYHVFLFKRFSFLYIFKCACFNNARDFHFYFRLFQVCEYLILDRRQPFPAVFGNLW